MNLQYILSCTAHKCVVEVDDIIKCSKNGFLGLPTIDYDSQVKKIESLKRKGEKEKEFIKKYVETKRTTLSSKIGKISFVFSVVAISASLILTISFVINPKFIEVHKSAYAALVILLIITFIITFTEYFRVLFEKDVSGAIIMAMEDKWVNQEESCSMTKLNEIDGKLDEIIEQMAVLNSICSKLDDIEKKIVVLNDEDAEQSNQ